MFKKKALEPLIATILLIVVAVILVTIVLAWGKNFSTEGLNKTNDVLNDDCAGAQLAISDCEIMSDGNITFQLKNIGQNYSFVSTDTFKIMLSHNSLGAEAEKTLTYAVGSFPGLTPGQTVIAKVAPVTSTWTDDAGDVINVMVRSGTCPQASVTVSNCHR
jgi:archaellum component FlaG (FlaF/FlaG flagellin family)